MNNKYVVDSLPEDKLRVLLILRVGLEGLDLLQQLLALAVIDSFHNQPTVFPQGFEVGFRGGAERATLAIHPIMNKGRALPL